MIGEPATERNAGTDIATEETLPPPPQPPAAFLTDSNYRLEARKLINSHLDKCHDDMRALGVEPPKWPVMDEQTITGLAASALFGTRWVLSFDHESIQPQLTLVPNDACVMSKERFISMLRHEEGYLVIKKRDLLGKLEA